MLKPSELELLADKIAKKLHRLNDEVLSVAEVAQLLNVSVTTVKNYADIMELKKDPAYLSSVRKQVSIKGHLVRWTLSRTKQNGSAASSVEKRK